TIAMTNVSGAGTGETKYYTKGYGLTGFRASNASGVFFESLFYKDGLSTSEPVLSCSGKDGTYDLSIYPEYDVDETMFYLSPIRNVIDSGTLQRTTEKLRKELGLQGYQAYCATEGVKIEPEYDTRDKISKYLEQYREPKILEMDAVETLNMAGAQYPLWRDVSNKQFLLSSLEEYFGFRDVYVAHPSEAILRSSPINSLLTEPQLCVQGWKNLVAQQLACEKLTNPGECELLTRKIPQLAFSSNTNAPRNQDTVKTLLDKLAAYEPNYREGTDVIGCKALTTTDREANQALLQGLINTPTYFDRSYRYGFLVAVIHSKDPGTSSGNIATKIFNFFTNKTRSLTPRDEVLVAAFKIPDIGTNKGGGDDTGSQFWSDSLDLTRKLLQTNEKNKTHEDVDRPNKRQTILDQAVGAATQGSGSKIYCVDGNNATSSCQDELTKALTDIINGSAEGCGEVEVVSVIKDIAGLDNPEEPYGKVFNADNGNEVMLNLFFGDLTHPELGSGKQTNPQVAKTDDPAEKLKSLFTISDDTWGPEVDSTTADFYIVYPMGFELNAVETAMKSAFFTKAQLTALETLNTVTGFQMTGQDTGLDSNGVGFSYVDIEKTNSGNCGTTIDPVTQLPVPNNCEEDVDITVTQESADVGILGGSLGFWLRKIQLQLNTRTSDAWKYFDSCKTTEEFFLGKCRGGGIVADGDVDTESPYGYDTCGLDTVNPSNSDLTYCYPENLEPYFAEAGFENPALEADKASRICRRESRGSPFAFNARCLEGTSVDYSIGLFQINMLPRCEGAFRDGAGIPDTSDLFDPYNLPCSVTNQERLNSCALSKVAIGERAAGIINEHLPLGAAQISQDVDQAVIDQKAEENIRAMVEIRRTHQNWSAWRTNGCSIE
ncbi:hypothetical protein KA017_03740, partial [Candidatus Woesebacteria bacterium]|nr:hypothetical protein [Candidatus Woesebacteria bacterium]